MLSCGTVALKSFFTIQELLRDKVEQLIKCYIYILLIFNKKESSIGVNKWVMSIQEKPKETIVLIYFFIFGRTHTENI